MIMWHLEADIVTLQTITLGLWGIAYCMCYGAYHRYCRMLLSSHVSIFKVMIASINYILGTDLHIMCTPPGCTPKLPHVTIWCTDLHIMCTPPGCTPKLPHVTIWCHDEYTRSTDTAKRCVYWNIYIYNWYKHDVVCSVVIFVNIQWYGLMNWPLFINAVWLKLGYYRMAVGKRINCLMFHVEVNISSML